MCPAMRTSIRTRFGNSCVNNELRHVCRASLLLCLLGFAAFLLFGLIDSEGVSQAENWLISTICCLLPIAGTGAAIALAGLVIWWARLRKR